MVQPPPQKKQTNKELNPERAEFIRQKGYNTAIINREKRNSELAHADQIRPQEEYEEQNEEVISVLPYVNDLLEQLLENETSEDEIMNDQEGQNELKKSDEDQIMQEDNLDYSLVWDRSKSSRERNMRDKESKVIQMVCLVLWHINPCRLFNA